MTKIAAVLLSPFSAKEAKLQEDQRKNVNVRVTFDDNKKTYFRVGKLKATDVEIKNWDVKSKKKKVTANWDKKLGCYIEDKRINPNYEDDNKLIRDVIHKVETIIKRLEQNDELVTGKKIKDLFSSRISNGLFNDMLISKMEKLREQNSIETAQTYKVVQSNLKRYCETINVKFEKLTINDIDYDLLTGFIQWGTTRPILNRRDRHWSHDYTENTKKRIRAVLNLGYKKGIGNAKKSPFLAKEDEPYIEIDYANTKPRELVLSYNQVKQLRDHKFYRFSWMDIIKLELLKTLLKEGNYRTLIEVKKTDYDTDKGTIIVRKNKSKQKATIKVTEEMKTILNWFETHRPSETEYLFPIITQEMIDGDLDNNVKQLNNKKNKRIEAIEKNCKVKLTNLKYASKEWKYYWNYEVYSRPLQFAQMVFLTSFYCQGINLTDMAFLTQDNVKFNYAPKKGEYKTIEFKRGKTGVPVRAYVSPKLQEILNFWNEYKKDQDNPYLIPIIQDYKAELNDQKAEAVRARGRVNVELKNVAKELKWPKYLHKIFFYGARHSIATHYADNNVPVTYIQKSLGHKNPETTVNYIKSLNREKEMDVIDRLLD